MKSSKYKFVSFNKKTGMWHAYFDMFCGRIYLGLHPTEDIAYKKVKEFYEKNITKR